MSDAPPISVPPQRHRFRIGLRAMFVVVTAVGILLGWVVYQLNWVRQRENALAAPGVFAYGDGTSPMIERQVPFGVWLMGGRHVETIQLPEHKQFTWDDVRRYESLFPESNVHLMSAGERQP